MLDFVVRWLRGSEDED